MTFLDDLLASTKARIELLKERVTPEALEQRLAAAEEPRGFRRSLGGDDVAIIAEIKRATPAKGDLNRELNASVIASDYARGGASAISVLTESDHFRGSLEDLYGARSAGLPTLRKDFILDEMQVLESRAEGADAVLLIVRILGDELGRLLAASRALGMDALVEVYSETDLARALDAGAGLIGVNHRDLETFEVDPERTAKLAPQVPEGTTVVALSGVSTRAEVIELGAAGAHAVLVGESLVTASDPAAKLKELLGRP